MVQMTFSLKFQSVMASRSGVSRLPPTSNNPATLRFDRPEVCGLTLIPGIPNWLDRFWPLSSCVSPRVWRGFKPTRISCGHGGSELIDLPDPGVLVARLGVSGSSDSSTQGET